MMTNASPIAPLLIELGTEELPPKTLRALAEAFARELFGELRARGLVAEDASAQHFATPRRLAVLVEGVAAQQETRVEDRRGPSVQAAFDEAGKPTAAALGFAKSCGAKVAELQTACGADGKGEWLVYRQKVRGASLAAALTECLPLVLTRLPIAKRMRWGDGAEEFVRPAHWLVVLHGDKTVATEVLGLRAGRNTRGHRFHADKKIAISHAARYAEVLEKEGKVIADFVHRRALIQTQIAALKKKAGVVDAAADDEALLDWVTSLVEFPCALLGEFDARFLKLPREVLISAMRDHQKYFHITDAKGKGLLPAFIAVANIESAVLGEVRQGNERVLRARLADAEFFWEKDLETPLEERVDALDGLMFHEKLGSVGEKSKRVAALAKHIAQQLSANAEEIAHTERAAHLSKADLVTDMVGEFPDLQGVIGRYYAQKSGQSKAVADAIEQHYLPRYAGDQLPRGVVAQSLALADRLDTLVGMFACGEKPSGDKDPFALRRAALGVLRILIEKNLDLDLRELLARAGQEFAKTAELSEEVFDFMLERLKFYYRDYPEFDSNAISAVLACKPISPLDFDLRIRALQKFCEEKPKTAWALAEANKRIANILNKAGYSFGEAHEKMDDAAVRKLQQKVDEHGARAGGFFAKQDYLAGLTELAKLHAPIDDFFTRYMVMHEDATIRNRRLAVLHRIRELFLQVADISHIAPSISARRE